MGRRHLGLEIGQVVLDGPPRFLPDRVQRRVNHAIPPQRRVGLVFGRNPFRRALVRRLGTLRPPPAGMVPLVRVGVAAVAACGPPAHVRVCGGGRRERIAPENARSERRRVRMGAVDRTDRFKLRTFLSRIGQAPVENLRLSVTPGGLVDLIYPLQDTTFAGSVASWIGRYLRAAPQASFTVQGVDNGRQVEFNASAPLPEVNADHPTLARTWAQARVNALLEQIDREGETREAIEEIIRLSRKYKFVTPYTSSWLHRAHC